MALDIEKIRADTPGVKHVNHLLAAGAGLMPQVVIDAMVNHLTLEGQIGGYEAAAKCKDALDGVYVDIATLLNAKPNEIAIVENATVAWCNIFYALPLKAGDHVITCEAEYAANYAAFLQRKRRDGIIIDVVPSDADGTLDQTALDALICERTALIAITWVPTNGGLVNPAALIGEIARSHGIPYLLDACQAVGQMPVDVQALGCDFLSATGRKFLRGPRGIGFLYVREDRISTIEPAMVDLFSATNITADSYELRHDARRFENWENAYALRAGLGAAVRYALDIGMDEIQARAWGLAQELRDGLKAIKGANIHDLGATPCAIVSFTIEGLDPVETATRLHTQGINISTSSPASTPLDAERRSLALVMRAAPHYYNTSAEVAQLVAALKRMISLR